MLPKRLFILHVDFLQSCELKSVAWLVLPSTKMESEFKCPDCEFKTTSPPEFRMHYLEHIATPVQPKPGK